MWLRRAPFTKLANDTLATTLEVSAGLHSIVGDAAANAYIAGAHEFASAQNLTPINTSVLAAHPTTLPTGAVSGMSQMGLNNFVPYVPPAGTRTGGTLAKFAIAVALDSNLVSQVAVSTTPDTVFL